MPPWPTLSLVRWLCLLPPGTFACSFAAGSRVHNVWCAICGECALRCSLPQPLSSSARPAIQCSGALDCALGCSPRRFARHISLKCRYSHRHTDDFLAVSRLVHKCIQKAENKLTPLTSGGDEM